MYSWVNVSVVADSVLPFHHASIGLEMPLTVDSDFDDAGEAVFTGQAVAAGSNNLSLAVPMGATVGTTYAGFRCTTDGVVSYTGEASDGEVEDYQVTITTAENSKFPYHLFLPGIMYERNKD